MGLLAALMMESAGSHLRAVPQFAYHEARGSGDAIERLSSHCRQVQSQMDAHRYKHHRHHVAQTPDLHGGLMFSLDLSKAFDRVNRQKLLSGMVRLGVPHNIVQLLNIIYHSTSFTLEYRGEHRRISTHQGIRQGCKAAPCCWSLFITNILHDLQSLTDEEWIKLCNTVFADDWITHVLIRDQTHLHQAIHRIGIMLDLLEDHGVQINLDKTKAMMTLRGTALRKINKRYLLRTKQGAFLCIPRKHGTSKISLVSNIAYLGIQLSYTALESKTMAHRQKSGNIATALLHKWLFSRRPLRLQHRIRIWRQCILPCHWYGLLHVGFRHQDLIQLDQLWMKQLRRITATPAHLTHMSNIALLQHYAIPDPLVQFHSLGVKLQARQLNRLQCLETTDILHYQPESQLPRLLQIIESCIQARRNPETPIDQCDPGWTCQDCHLTFSSQAQFRRHLTMIHDCRLGQIRAYQMTEAQHGEPTCARCGTMFTTWHALKYHSQFVCMQSPQEPSHDPALQHRSELRRYLAANLYNLHLDTTLCEQLTTCCCLCLRICSGEAGLLRHFAVDHVDEYNRHGLFMDQIEHAAMKTTPCSYCLTPVQKVHQCIVHRQLALLMARDRPGPVTSSAEDRMHQCHCGKAFVTAHGLKAHQDRVHTRARPILTDADRELLISTLVTDDWQEVLDQQSILTALSTGCVMCEQSFSKRALLTRHLRQEHARHWTQAADQAAQLESLYKEDGTCYCDPQLTTKHTCVIFLQLALLQRHWSDTCAEDLTTTTDTDAPAPLIAPDFNKLVHLALRMGSVAMLLQSNVIRLYLSTRCLQCRRHYDVHADMMHHLTHDHRDTWIASLPFLTLLQHTFFTSKGCTCLPALVQGDSTHTCATLVQIAAAAMEMPDLLVLPYSFSSLEMTPMLRPWLSQTLMPDVLEWLLTRNFEAIIQNEQLQQIMQTHCITCNQAFMTDELALHLWNFHVRGTQHAAPVLHMLNQLMATMVPAQSCDLCNLCLEDDDTQALMDHLSCRCPVLLQLAMLLTFPNHVNVPFDEAWPAMKERRKQVHRRQLTLVDGLARVLQPIDPTDATLITTWLRILQHVYVEPVLLESLRLKCWHCQQLFLHESHLLEHLQRFHAATTARIQICYDNLAQDILTAEQCPLGCPRAHLTDPCPVLTQLACILCQSDGRLRPRDGRPRRSSSRMLETHHPSRTTEEVVGANKRARRERSAEKQETPAAPTQTWEHREQSAAPPMDVPTDTSPDSSRRLTSCDPLRTAVSDSFRSRRAWHPSEPAAINGPVAIGQGQTGAFEASFGVAHSAAHEGASGLHDSEHGQPRHPPKGQGTTPVDGRGPDAVSAMGCKSPEVDSQHKADAHRSYPGDQGAPKSADRHAEPGRDPSISFLEENDCSDRRSTGMPMDLDGDGGSRMSDAHRAAQALLSLSLATYRGQVQTTESREVATGKGSSTTTSATNAIASLKAVRILTNPESTCCFVNAPLQGLTWQTLLLGQMNADGWAKGQQLFQRLTTFTPQPLHVVTDPLFQAVFRDRWTDFSTQADALEFAEVMLAALQPQSMSNGWTNQTDFKGLANETELAVIKSPDLVPIQLNVFQLLNDCCTLQALISMWHDQDGLTKGLLQPGASVVLSMPRTDDSVTARNQTDILECDRVFSLPYFGDHLGNIMYAEYVAVAVTFHLGTVATQGHFRTALRVSRGWLAYEDGQVPEQWPRLSLPPTAQVVLLWAIRTDLWLQARSHLTPTDGSTTN
eukprot:Skav227143  [mRNA]  locus=scaffold133:549400:554637:- [translate_table: standard]